MLTAVQIRNSSADKLRELLEPDMAAAQFSELLEAVGISAYRLSRLSGVSLNHINRFLNADRLDARPAPRYIVVLVLCYGMLERRIQERFWEAI